MLCGRRLCKLVEDVKVTLVLNLAYNSTLSERRASEDIIGRVQCEADLLQKIVRDDGTDWLTLLVEVDFEVLALEMGRATIQARDADHSRVESCYHYEGS